MKGTAEEKGNQSALQNQTCKLSSRVMPGVLKAQSSLLLHPCAVAEILLFLEAFPGPFWPACGLGSWPETAPLSHSPFSLDSSRWA